MEEYKQRIESKDTDPAMNIKDSEKNVSEKRSLRLHIAHSTAIDSVAIQWNNALVSHNI